jgi:hypothetical protein
MKTATTWTEAGTMISRDGEPLTLIEQEGFGTVCGILDIEGESVFRILRAVNAHDDLLEALKEAYAVIRHAAQESKGRVRNELVGGWKWHAERCKAAIAKAEGRG